MCKAFCIFGRKLLILEIILLMCGKAAPQTHVGTVYMNFLQFDWQSEIPNNPHEKVLNEDRGFNLPKASSQRVGSGHETIYTHMYIYKSHTHIHISSPHMHTPSQGKLEMSSEEGVTIKKMTSWGAGVWVSFRGSATLELYHSVTREPLQQINIKGTLTQLIASKTMIVDITAYINIS